MFVLFVALVLGRAVLLLRKGIKAIVFGATDKTDFLLIPFVLALIYTFIAGAFGLPIWEPLIKPFWETQYPAWLELLFARLL